METNKIETNKKLSKWEKFWQAYWTIYFQSTDTKGVSVGTISTKNN